MAGIMSDKLLFLPEIPNTGHMKSGFRVFPILLTFIILAAFSYKRTDYREGRYRNVCKDLKANVLLYFIFIDTRTTSPWTEFDISSTIDSVNVAVRWIESQADKNKIPLKIKVDYYIGNDYATISRNLPRGTVRESVEEAGTAKGLAEINKWADYISARAGESFSVKSKDGIPKQNNPRDAERLIAWLRDEYSVESVALLFMVNNYYRSDISFAFNTMNTEYVEYAIVSYKYPSEIAHNFLHLYGAADLYQTPLRRSLKKVKAASEFFPDDIMQDPYAKKIWTQEIDDYTRYLIGWADDLESRYQFLLLDKYSSY